MLEQKELAVRHFLNSVNKIVNTKNHKKTLATFKGCIMETCQIGGSRQLRGIYEIPAPDGSVALYELHTSQIRGAGWKMTSQIPTYGRVHAEISENYDSISPRVWGYNGPETVEVEWKPRWLVMAENAAICLVGRAHISSNQRGLKNNMEPACSVGEAMSGYTEEKFPGWSLDHDTGHGDSTPCPDISAQIAHEKERVDKEFDKLLNRQLVERAEWLDDGGMATFRCLRDTDAETIARAIAFNCGIHPNYHVPMDWKPSQESQKKLAEMRAEKKRREEEEEEAQLRFKRGWEILRGRYIAALEGTGLILKNDSVWLRNEFRVVFAASTGREKSVYAGGLNGPNFHTSYVFAADWLDKNAETFNVSAQIEYAKRKLAEMGGGGE